MKVDFILLDICNTLVKFQTANAFIEYVIERIYPQKRIILTFLKKTYAVSAFKKVFNKVGYPLKFVLLSLIKETQKEELDVLAKEFFEYLILPSFNSDVLMFLEKHKKAEVIIVSGGYDTYLKYVANFIGASSLVSSELAFSKDGKFTGRLKGSDCVGINKVIKLSERGILHCLDFERTAVLSDSISDIPLFSLGKHKVAVNPDKELKKLIGHGWYLLEEVLG